MNPQEILALAPGPELDEAVHRHVYGQSGHEPAPHFSTDFAAGERLLARLPLFVARAEKPKDPAKPWLAGTLRSDPSSTALHTTMTVTGPTMLGVLCRAALLVALKSPPPPKAETESKVGPAPVRPIRRAASRRANGAEVGTKTPSAAGERAVSVIRQPTIFLGSRSKLAPLPKRKPFTIPGDPAK